MDFPLPHSSSSKPRSKSHSTRSSFNKLESYFSDSSKRRKSKTPEKTAEYYSKNIMPTYGEFERDFEDKKTNVEYAISYGEKSNEWYEYYNSFRFNFSLARKKKAKWDDQLLFVRAKKDVRMEHGVPSIGDEVLASSDEGMFFSFKITGSFFENNRRATGYVIASDFRTFPNFFGK